MDTPSAGGAAGHSILGRWRAVRCAARYARCCGPWCRSSGRNAIGWPTDRRRPALRRASQWRQLSPAELTWCPWIPAARPAEPERGESAGRGGGVYLRGHLRAIRTSRSLADSAGGNRTPRPVAPWCHRPLLPNVTPERQADPRHPHARPQDHEAWPGRSPHPPTSPPTSAGSPSPSRYCAGWARCNRLRSRAARESLRCRPSGDLLPQPKCQADVAPLAADQREGLGGRGGEVDVGETKLKAPGQGVSAARPRRSRRIFDACVSGPSDEVTKGRMGLLDEKQHREQSRRMRRAARDDHVLWGRRGPLRRAGARRPRQLQNVTLMVGRTQREGARTHAPPPVRRSGAWPRVGRGSGPGWTSERTRRAT